MQGAEKKSWVGRDALREEKKGGEREKGHQRELVGTIRRV